MAAYSTIRKSLFRAASQALIEYFPTSVEQNKGIFFSHTGGSEPSTPFVVINILGIQQTGRSQTSGLLDASLNVSVQASYEVTVQFSFCGSTAGDMAQSFTQRLNGNPIVMEAFRREGLGYMRKSNLRRAPQKRDTQWVEYFNQDFIFSYVVNIQQPIDYVETVIVEDQTQDPSQTFTVPPNVPIP